MKYALDSSAIINLIMKLEERSVDIFKESVTADLAYYEIGNFLWKVKRADLLGDFSNIMKFLNVESVGLNEEVLVLSSKEGTTYYDAVYLFLSRKLGLQLISDDKDLVIKGAKKSSEIQ